MAGAVPSPEGCRGGAAVDTLATLYRDCHPDGRKVVLIRREGSVVPNGTRYTNMLHHYYHPRPRAKREIEICGANARRDTLKKVGEGRKEVRRAPSSRSRSLDVSRVNSKAR